MDLSDGWEPLCKFLNKPVPEKPFPRVNNAKAADDYATGVIIKVLGFWAGILATVRIILHGGISLWTTKMF
jgi:hypothetical protein